MKNYIKIQMLVLALTVLFVLDAIWIWSMKPRYNMWIKAVQAGRPVQFRIAGVIMSYLSILVVLIFIILPSARADKRKSNVLKALRWGGVGGLAVYGVFNATNYGIFAGYPWQMAVLDTMWGGLLFSIVTWTALLKN